MLRIGCSQSDITPTLPVLMGGSYQSFQCHEVRDPIMASCIIFDDGRTRVAMVSCDLGDMHRDMTLSIRERVNCATGMARENIHLMATHNHSAPTVFPVSELPLHNAALEAQLVATRQELVDDIAACVIKAHENFVPARMGYGRGRFETGAFNRRFIMSNGRSQMYGGGNLERLKREGPVDREEQVVWFEDYDGRPLAVMVNYSSHAANLYGKPIMSADFPGVMRSVLQGVLGKDVPILYLQGACGNVVGNDVEHPGFPTRENNARRIGRGLAGEALRMMSDHFTVMEDVAVSACRRMLEIPYREPPMPFAEARKQMAHYKDNWDDFRQLDLAVRAAITTSLRIEAYMRKALAEEVEIAAFALGDVFFVINPAELFVEFQIDIKAHFKNRKVIMCELTNGRSGYVPTKLACALGGYETIVTRFNPGAGEMIRDASRELIEQLIG